MIKFKKDDKVINISNGDELIVVMDSDATETRCMKWKVDGIDFRSYDNNVLMYRDEYNQMIRDKKIDDLLK